MVPDSHPNGPSPSRMADVLDRLAAALEQQARSLEDLRIDVGTLIGSVRQIEKRLGDLEAKRTPTAKPAKKRGK
jgi:K+/H+ antiporter YhaU regulatory subunit KhtT